MSHMIKCPHCGKPAVSLAFVRDEGEHKAHVKEMRAIDAAMAIRIDSLPLSARARNGLENYQTFGGGYTKEDGSWQRGHYTDAPIRTLGDLCRLTAGDLCRASGIGRVTQAEIRAVLKAHGLYLGMTESGA